MIGDQGGTRAKPEEKDQGIGIFPAYISISFLS